MVRIGKWEASEEELRDEFKHAAENAAKARTTEPRAVSARYDREGDRIVVILQNGWEFGFKPWLAQGLEEATPEQLAEVEILGSGTGLHWESLDADLGIDELLAGRYGSRAHMARVAAKLTGKAGGSKTSEAKAAAARANGAKGGRPKSKPDSEFKSAKPDRT